MKAASKAILFFAAAALAVCSGLARFAGAEEQEETRLSALPGDVGMIDQIISVPFDPVAVFLLQETDNGEVKQYPAAAVELPDTGAAAGRRRLIIGAPVRAETPRHENEMFHFSFFLAGQDSAFAATEVKRWRLRDLKEQTTGPRELVQEINSLEEKLQLKRAHHAEIQASLAVLREDASKISEISEIVKLKLELEAVHAAYDHKEKQAERLRRLIEAGRQIEDPEGIDQYRLELSAALTEAAKVTALADRLSKRQEQAARQNFLRKINMVRELDNGDPQQLAREILQLRRQRRELENRLGLSSPAQSEEF